MANTIVSGTLRKPNGEVWAGAAIEFELERGSYTSTDQYPKNRVRSRTNSEGRFSVSLWRNAEGQVATQYVCTLPSAEKFAFSIPATMATAEISVLRAASESLPGSTQNVIFAYIDDAIAAHNLAATAHPGLVDAIVAPHNLDPNAHPNLATGSSASFERSFVNADLSIAGVLPVTHNLATHPSGVEIWTNSSQQIDPDSIEYLGTNAVAIGLESFMPIAGTWRVSVTR